MKKILLTFIALMTVLAVPAYSKKCEEAKLSLSSEATIRKPADELQMKIGVVTISETAEKALAENSLKMQAVIESLEAAGLTSDEYHTEHFFINPTYSSWTCYQPADWKPSIIGYEVSNMLSIHTKKIDMAGKIIDVANKAGANSVSEIRFNLNNPRDYWKEALTAATENAISDAETIASVSGVQLKRLLNVSLNNTYVYAPYMQASFSSMDCGFVPPIEPCEVSITAYVSIVYEIAE